ncbi:radical SAM protein [Sedimentibacter sp.]|uniref:radical SAM protein n=1 Tax=Sedimentibacter sp. TaxID=1960295 RepID=UPI00289D37E4|nr:radical SAM protein [Sedimentibacter sp.]
MNNKIELYHSGLTVTQRCTLRCKLCAGYSPYYNPQPHYSFERLSEILKRYFAIVDYVQKFTITGGEPFLHEELDKILIETIKYRKQFGMIEIITNGTLFPSEKLKAVLEKYATKDGCITLLVDHYGELSKKIYELEQYFNKKDINHKIRIYYGENAHCGGWVNFGDFSKKLIFESQIIEKFEKCAIPSKLNYCLTIKNGEMHPCTFSHRIMELNLIERNKDEYIDLFDNNTLEQQKEKILHLFNIKSLSACAYCNGMHDNSIRYVPAEQL